MIKEYRKMATIKAEQFDGSPEMVFKYDIFPDYSGNNVRYFIETKEGQLEIKEGDWIATGVEGEHWAIADDIFRKTYEEVE